MHACCMTCNKYHLHHRIYQCSCIQKNRPTDTEREGEIWRISPFLCTLGQLIIIPKLLQKCVLLLFYSFMSFVHLLPNNADTYWTWFSTFCKKECVFMWFLTQQFCFCGAPEWQAYRLQFPNSQKVQTNADVFSRTQNAHAINPFLCAYSLGKPPF